MENGMLIYNPLNLSIEEQRKYNVEKYHFLSGIIDILFYHLQLKKMYDLNEDGIYRHFESHQLKTNRIREKFNLALAQLVGSGYIEKSTDGYFFLTKEGIEAYSSQLFHSIAASLYSAERSNHLAKIAIIAASVLSIISIICTIISIICH